MTAWVQAFVCVLCAASGPTGQVAYVSGTSEIDQRVSVLDVVSGNVTPVGFGQYDANPAWSSDGSWLAFSTKVEGGISIGVVRADGTERRLLSHSHNWNRYPTWAPGSMRLMYAANDSDALEQRCVVFDLTTGTETVWGGEAKSVLRPVWMPNRNLLTTFASIPKDPLSSSGEGMPIDLEKLDVSGNAISPLGSVVSNKLTVNVGFVTPDIVIPANEKVLPSSGSYVIWGAAPSPKGTSVAFESNDGGDREIFVFSKRGSADVTNHRAPDWNPVWSPDSQWIAFESLREGHQGIYRVFPETARTLPVTQTADGDCWAPSWSPDGNWIVYVSNRSGDCHLYVTPITGKAGDVQLTTQGKINYSPVWRPIPRKEGRR